MRLNQYIRRIVNVASVAALFAFCPVQSQANSKKVQLKATLPQPEWNASTVCKTAGMVLNAPALTLTFKADPSEIKDSRYDYKWEQQMDQGAWQVVKEEKNILSVPGLRIDGIQNRGKSAVVYNWRVSVRDAANETEWVESEISTLTITPQMSATIKISDPSNGTYSVDLTVSGGSGERKYLWTGSQITESQKSQEDQKVLKPGDYKVIITDDCGTISVPVQIKNN